LKHVRISGIVSRTVRIFIEVLAMSRIAIIPLVLKSTGTSLLPDGLGRELPPAEMEHLLAFLSAGGVAARYTYPGPGAPHENYPDDPSKPKLTDGQMSMLLRGVSIGTADEYRVIGQLFQTSLHAGRGNATEELRAVLELSLSQPLRFPSSSWLPLRTRRGWPIHPRESHGACGLERLQGVGREDLKCFLLPGVCSVCEAGAPVRSQGHKCPRS
jgi:hypothetical protein